MEIIDYARLDDAALSALVCEGDTKAFDLLFARHSDSIHAMLLKRSQNSMDVEDIMQEAFMKAFINISKYDSRYNFGAWICTIAKNTQIDAMRSLGNSALNPSNLSLEGSHTQALLTMTPEEKIINDQKGAQIQKCLSMLPEQYRRLFELRFIEEYSYEEISEKLALNMNTVKTQIRRARAIMCRLITEGEQTEQSNGRN